MRIQSSLIRTWLVILVAFSNYAAFGFTPPTQQEQELFDKLTSELVGLELSRKITDTLDSFSEPVVIFFPCDSGSLYSTVNATIKTKLARFDSSLAHTEGVTTGGIYMWRCSITAYGDKLVINCDNELMLNSDALLNSEKNAKIKRIEDIVVLYHELLHGQLMMDAIKSNESWRHNTCNKSHQDELDYSYSDGTHQIISPLQTELASRLVKESGGFFKAIEVNQADTSDGAFSKKIGSMYDFPEYIKSGIEVSARSYNIVDLKINSQKNDIIISGMLNEKSQKGTVWLYIFGSNTQAQTPNTMRLQQIQEQIPSWIKNNAKWWSEGTISDSEFIDSIKFLIEKNIIIASASVQNSKSQNVPSWIKNNAKWWSEGTISDSEFVVGIEYLINYGIIRIETNSEATQKTLLTANSGIFHKDGYKPVQVQLAGRVENFASGTYVILTVIRPDHTSFELKSILTGKGEFALPLLLEPKTQSGRYTVIAKYGNEQFGAISFIVN